MIRRLPSGLLGLFAAINIVRGGIHSLAPDGGAHSIAGLTLASEAQTIVSLFATIGLMQAALGLFEAWVLLRRRDLLLPVLGLQTLQTFAGVVHLWLWRPLPVVVPGAGFNLALLVVLVLGWLLILAGKERVS